MNEQPRVQDQPGRGRPPHDGNGKHAADRPHEQREANHETHTSSMGLVTQLTREMTDLFTKEVALARSEMTNAMKSAKAGVGSVASGGMVLFSGFLVLLWAAVLGLSEVMAPWLAAVIVGGVVALIGYGMLKSGQKKLEPQAFKPSHTTHSMRKDRDAVKGATS